MILLDARTGKRLRTLAVAPCTSDFGFLDDTIWIQGSKCNWIDEWSYLLDRDGHPRAVLDQIHAMWARPTPLDGDLWAIPGTAGDGYVVFEASTGVVRGVQRSTPHYDDIGCHDCTPASAKGPGEVPAFTRTPGGRTLLFTAGVAVLTPDLGAVERHWPLPVCAAPAAPTP